MFLIYPLNNLSPNHTETLEHALVYCLVYISNNYDSNNYCKIKFFRNYNLAKYNSDNTLVGMFCMTEISHLIRIVPHLHMARSSNK